MQQKNPRRRKAASAEQPVQTRTGTSADAEGSGPTLTSKFALSPLQRTFGMVAIALAIAMIAVLAQAAEVEAVGDPVAPVLEETPVVEVLLAEEPEESAEEAVEEDDGVFGTAWAAFKCARDGTCAEFAVQADEDLTAREASVVELSEALEQERTEHAARMATEAAALEDELREAKAMQGRLMEALNRQAQRASTLEECIRAAIPDTASEGGET